MSYSIIYVTFNNQENAREVATIIVKEKLVACANLFNQIESIFEWHGEIKNDIEIIMIAKTSTSLVNKTIKKIRALHLYDYPCILSFKIDNGEKNYLKWIESSVNHDIKNTC